MRLHSAILSAALLLSAPLLTAQMTTYDYTGLDYTTVAGGTFNTTEDVSGFFTTATLGPSFSGIISTPVAFSFFDGNQTITDIGPGATGTGLFNITTDINGNIVSADINLANSSDSIKITDDPPCASLGSCEDDSQVTVYGGNNYGIVYASGKWNISATPEPSSFVLMSTALLGFAFIARKQLAPRLLPAMRINR
jgi:hypothetical protein